MACLHPLKAFPIGYTDSGKVKYKICSQEVRSVLYDYIDSKFIACFNYVYTARLRPRERLSTESINVPCGKCIGCRLDYSRRWADRCMLELQYHSSSYFVTLTYDDEHLPCNEYVDDETGETGTDHSLVKRDVQLFVKRLRKAYKKISANKIKYFCAGEYGEETHRPHYHIIIFGLELGDLQRYKRTSEGFWLYTSAWLSEVWNLGHVVVAECSWDTCAYTARYIMKKQYGETANYEKTGIIPEFTLMSLKPAIGREWFEEHGEDLYKYDFVSVSTPSGGKRIYSNRYYDKLYDVDHHDFMLSIKEKRRKLAEEMNEIKLGLTNKTYIDMLESEEIALVNRAKALKRSDCFIKKKGELI